MEATVLRALEVALREDATTSKARDMALKILPTQRKKARAREWPGVDGGAVRALCSAQRDDDSSEVSMLETSRPDAEPSAGADIVEVE